MPAAKSRFISAASAGLSAVSIPELCRRPRLPLDSPGRAGSRHRSTAAPELLGPLLEHERRSEGAGDGARSPDRDAEPAQLTATADQLDSLVDEAGRRDLTIREALSLFREREIARKDERRIDTGIGLARFPFVRDLEGFDFAAQPSIDKKQIRELTAGRFIANAGAKLLLGPPGVGKTHLAVAIGRQAILAGYTVQFIPAPTLVAQAAKAHSEGRLEDRLTHFGKPKLLIVDELGYLPFEPAAAHLFFQLVSRRYERGRHDHQQSLDRRVGHGVRRRGGSDRHPRPPAAS